ncbi:CDP-alcohol phosphatidyltransferase [Stagonosporopsis vannaccii]|nr:CDP-alcohol phosphatidyltransferase [Stagonosporopsis vannaccii]
MACRISTASSTFMCSSSGGSRTVARLKSSHSFLPISSRASYCWARNHRTRQRPTLLIQNCKGLLLLQRSSVFSTSSRLAVEHKAEKEAGSQGLPGHEPEINDLSTTAKVAATLKSSLKLDTPAQRHEQIYNIPNFLTFTRLVATPVVGYLIVHDQHLAAFSLFTYAAFSDLLDGWIARKWKLQTVVGSVVDPMADKLLMTTLVTCLAVNGSMAAPLAVIILGRDVSLAVSALYYRYASLPAPKTMARYWDFSLPSAEVHPTQISKFNTFLQLSLLGTLLCTNLLHDPAATTSAAGGFLLSIQDALGGEAGVKNLVTGLSAVVASTTLYSGLEYTWKKDAVKILGGNDELKRKQGLRGRMIMLTSYGAFIAVAAALWFRGSSKDEVKGEEKKA